MRKPVDVCVDWEPPSGRFVAFFGVNAFRDCDGNASKSRKIFLSLSGLRCGLVAFSRFFCFHGAWCNKSSESTRSACMFNDEFFKDARWMHERWLDKKRLWLVEHSWISSISAAISRLFVLTPLRMRATFFYWMEFHGKDVSRAQLCHLQFIIMKSKGFTYAKGDRRNAHRDKFLSR